MSIRQAGSRFAPYLENIAELGMAGCVGNVVDSTGFERIVTNRLPHVDSIRFETNRVLHVDSTSEKSIRDESRSNRHLFATPVMDYRV